MPGGDETLPFVTKPFGSFDTRANFSEHEVLENLAPVPPQADIASSSRAPESISQTLSPWELPREMVQQQFHDLIHGVPFLPLHINFQFLCFHVCLLF